MPWNKLALKLGGKGNVKQHFPFEINKKVDGNGSVYITVRPGTVTNLLPANILDTQYISSSSNWYIKLSCQTNGRVPTYIWVYVDTSPEITTAYAAQNTAPPVFDIILGVIDQRSQKIYQVVYDNLFVTPDIAFIESIAPPDQGAEPFLRWWTWKVS